MFARRFVDICCIQEVRWRDTPARFFKAKAQRYKIFWDEIRALGILQAEKLEDMFIEVVGVFDRIILLRLDL